MFNCNGAVNVAVGGSQSRVDSGLSDFDILHCSKIFISCSDVILGT